MKNTCLLLLLCLQSALVMAKNGYDIQIVFKQPITDQYIYLAKYYAKPMPTIYQVDSAKVTNNTARFQQNDSILGGVYLVLFDKKSKFIETILDNGNNYSIQIDTLDLPFSVKYTNSVVNEDYLLLQKSFIEIKSDMDAINAQLASKSIDTKKFQQQSKMAYENLQNRNRNFATQQKNPLLKNIVFAMLPPQEPTTKKYLEDGKTVDSIQHFYTMKENYWKDFNFADNRLINTPIYEGKLSNYFNSYVYNSISDSLNKDADYLLLKTRNSKELFKYTLHWLTNYTYNSKIMGIDQSFVHLVEKYYIPGDAIWLDSVTVQKYVDRIKQINPNALGSKGANIKLDDLYTLEAKHLYDFDAEYTMLVIWSIDCSHCLEEIPKLKTIYDEQLKQKGVKVYAVIKGKEQSAIQQKVKEFGLESWTNVIDAKGNPDYLDNYDAYATPKVYILDKNKVIKGKGLDHTNVSILMEHLENDNKKK